jgi:hypothetical protein
MTELQILHEVLRDKKILSIEAGRMPGWMMINFEPQAIVAEYEPGDSVFLSVFVGGRNGSDEDEYFSTCALYLTGKDGSGSAYMVRDGRDPDMPMASAARATGRVRICNYEFEYEGEICGAPVYVHGLCESHYQQLTAPDNAITEAE